MANKVQIKRSSDPSRSNSHSEDPASSEGGNIIVTRGRIPSPTEDTLFDFGKDLVKGSLAQSLEFHKTMLGLTATFATLMASSFGVLALGSKDIRLDSLQRAYLIVPVLLMLSSAMCFALGYYPRDVQVQLRFIETIKDVRSKLLRIRKIYALLGILFFTLSILFLIGGILLSSTA